MSAPRCPGQDQRYWRPEDIFEQPCPACGRMVEIWKDEPEHPCPGCGFRVRNLRLNPACAAWCPKAPECLGAPPAPCQDV